MDERKEKMVLVIQANIGAGKSELLKRLANMGLKTICEPIEKWGELLEREKEGRGEDYSVHLQTRICHVLIERETEIREKLIDNEAVFIERDLDSAINIFIPTAKNNNTISGEGLETLQTMCYSLKKLEKLEDEIWEREHGYKIRREIIYLKTNPKTCFERIKKRNQQGDNTITQKYVNDIHEQHESWLNGQSRMTIAEENQNQWAEIIWNMMQTKIATWNRDQESGAPSASPF